MGEQVLRNKNIYILQSVYKDIHKFTKNKLEIESGGVLVGYTLNAGDKTNIIINGFIEAKYSEATSTTLKFTHQTWDYVNSEKDANFPDEKILGWIHTHPDFGIFLSDYDKFIHNNFFSDENQIAYVIDPIRQTEGFFFWINGEIEACPGFYIYDDIGIPVELENKKSDENNSAAKVDNAINNHNGNLIIGLLIASLCLSFTSLGIVSSKITQLNQKVNELTESVDLQKQSVESEYDLLNQSLGDIKAETNKCTVAFLNYDGTILVRNTYYVGDIVTEPVDTPTRESDEQYDYSFLGWDSDVTPVYGDMVYYAQYTTTLREYTVRFLDVDGNELSSEKYHYGDKVIIPEYSPQKKDDEKKQYIFKWNQEVTDVTCDMTYQGEFVENTFTVRFIREDGTLLEEVSYDAGETIDIDNPESYEDNGSQYIFDHWDRKFETVSEDTEYIAYYTKAYTE
jgi:proteasome lid subunit RPN8/RPN11